WGGAVRGEEMSPLRGLLCPPISFDTSIKDYLFIYLLVLSISMQLIFAYIFVSSTHSNRGQIWEAIILMERSIRLDSRFGEPYEGLATQYAQIGQMAIAERLHRKAIRLRPRHADFYNNYGAFLQKTGMDCSNHI